MLNNFNSTFYKQNSNLCMFVREFLVQSVCSRSPNVRQAASVLTHLGKYFDHTFTFLDITCRNITLLSVLN